MDEIYVDEELLEWALPLLQEFLLPSTILVQLTAYLTSDKIHDIRQEQRNGSLAIANLKLVRYLQAKARACPQKSAGKQSTPIFTALLDILKQRGYDVLERVLKDPQEIHEWNVHKSLFECYLPTMTSIDVKDFMVDLISLGLLSPGTSEYEMVEATLRNEGNEMAMLDILNIISRKKHNWSVVLLRALRQHQKRDGTVNADMLDTMERKIIKADGDSIYTRMQYKVSDQTMTGPTSISQISWDIMHELTIFLDPSSLCGNDWRALADWLGFKNDFITYLDSHNKRTKALIQEIYPARYTDASVEEIICALDELVRYDARDLLLRNFPGIDLEKLRRSGPPRKMRNFSSDDDGQLDTAQQHREECFSGCGDSLADDDSEMQSPYDSFGTLGHKTFRRELTNCGLTGEPLKNGSGHSLPPYQVPGHSGILPNNHMSQIDNDVNYPQCTSPLRSIPVPQNYTFQNGWGQYSPTNQRANGQLATDQAQLQYGSYPGNFNPTASNGGCCHSCLSTVGSQMSHPLHMHSDPIADPKSQMESFAGQTFMSLTRNINDGPGAMEGENSCSSLDLSSLGQMVSPQGRSQKMALSQGHSHQIASQGRIINWLLKVAIIKWIHLKITVIKWLLKVQSSNGLSSRSRSSDGFTSKSQSNFLRSQSSNSLSKS